jgi:hypothetical protein
MGLVKQSFDESKGYKLKRIAFEAYQAVWGQFKDTQIDGLATFPVTMLHEVRDWFGNNTPAATRLTFIVDPHC